MYFLLSIYFNMTSLLDVILVSTWLHFSFPKQPKIVTWRRLRRVLGRLGGLLGHLRVVLETSWAVLEASEAVLEASGAPCLLPQDNTQRSSAVLGGPRGAANHPPVSP